MPLFGRVLINFRFFNRNDQITLGFIKFFTHLPFCSLYFSHAVLDKKLQNCNNHRALQTMPNSLDGRNEIVVLYRNLRTWELNRHLLDRIPRRNQF